MFMLGVVVDVMLMLMLMLMLMMLGVRCCCGFVVLNM